MCHLTKERLFLGLEMQLVQVDKQLEITGPEVHGPVSMPRQKCRPAL